MSARAVAAALLALLLGGVSLQAATRVETRLAPDGRGAGDHFGATVAVGVAVGTDRAGESLVAVGAHLSDAGGKDSGAVYVFRKGDGVWQLARTIIGTAGSQLGFDLAFQNGALLAGAPFAQVGSVGCGAVYRLAVEGEPAQETVTESARLQLPSEACVGGAEIGSAIAAEGGILAVGARGADRRAGRVYVLGGCAPLTATGVTAGDEFGLSLATDGTTLAASAPFGGGGRSGVVRVFHCENRSWREETLTAGHPQLDAAFGYGLAVQRSRLVVGSPLADGAGIDAGAVSLFDQTAAGWVERVVVPGGKAGDQFGVSVAIADGGTFAGARRGGGQRNGAAFEIGPGGSATPIPHQVSQANAEFGFALAARGDLLAVGAFLEDAPLPDSGAAYVFEPEPPIVPPQTVTVRFARPASTVAESAGAASPLLVVTTSDKKPTAAAVSVDVSVCAEDACTATAGSDYVWPVPPAVTAVVPVTVPANTPHGAKLRLVRVPVLADAIACESGESFAIRLANPRPSARLGAPSVHRVTILDDDAPGLEVVSATPLATTEAGGTATLTLRLRSQPAAPVTVSAFTLSLGVAEGIVSSPPLIFTAANWSLPQSFTVTGADDPLCDGPRPYKIQTTAASADTCYAGLAPVPAVNAINADDDHTCLAGVKRVCVDSDGTVVYTLRLSSRGTAGQANLPGHELFDTLPPELAVVTASATSGVATVDYVANTVAWNGPVPPGPDVVTVTIVAALDAVPAGTEVRNSALLTFNRDDKGPLETSKTDADPAGGGPEDQTVFRAGDVGCFPPTP